MKPERLAEVRAIVESGSHASELLDALDAATARAERAEARAELAESVGHMRTVVLYAAAAITAESHDSWRQECADHLRILADMEAGK